MKNLRWLILLALVCTAAIGPLPAEEKQPCHDTETKAEVPALFEFHEVIYKIWHEAWPNSDTGLLTELVPEVEAGVAKVAASQLPGILRDRKAAWDKGVADLQQLAKDYKTAAAAKENKALLDAAEKLHAQFERLVRTIRPATKEIEAFHVVLYRLYHYELPAFEAGKVKATVAELKEKMNALNAAELPERRKNLAEAYKAARAKLSAAVDDLSAKAQGKDDAAVKTAIETMHSAYQALEKVFD